MSFAEMLGRMTRFFDSSSATATEKQVFGLAPPPTRSSTRLRSASQTEIKTYVQNNVTDLPSARVFLAKMACAVAYALAGGTDK